MPRPLSKKPLRTGYKERNFWKVEYILWFYFVERIFTEKNSVAKVVLNAKTEHLLFENLFQCPTFVNYYFNINGTWKNKFCVFVTTFDTRDQPAATLSDEIWNGYTFNKQTNLYPLFSFDILLPMVLTRWNFEWFFLSSLSHFL